jgi:hypothetical protein
MSKCIKCGSYAFNLYKEDIDQGGLCDVHYWQNRAHRAEAQPEQEQEPAAKYIPCCTDQTCSKCKAATPPQRKPDNEAYTALEQALTRLQKRYGELEAKVAAQQQPVGYVAENGVVDWNVCAPPILTNLYTTPPQRKWVWLTNGELADILKRGDVAKHDAEKGLWHVLPYQFAKAVEVKLKELNK